VFFFFIPLDSDEGREMDKRKGMGWEKRGLEGETRISRLAQGMTDTCISEEA
jgi:hypothetical protein